MIDTNAFFNEMIAETEAELEKEYAKADKLVGALRENYGDQYPEAVEMVTRLWHKECTVKCKHCIGWDEHTSDSTQGDCMWLGIVTKETDTCPHGLAKEK